MKLDIQIRGARLHNLKNVSVTIPSDSITAICGPSGCGKSTLALDVLHAECKRRYLETLSPFIARLAGGRKSIPVDTITGLRPSIAFESWEPNSDPRASVGHLTECDALLRGIWIQVAQFQCPVCSKNLEILNLQEMVERIMGLPVGSKLHLLSPIPCNGESLSKLAATWMAQGFVRAFCDGNFYELSQIDAKSDHIFPAQFSVVVDRWIIKEGIRTRIADSIAIALRIGQGSLSVLSQDSSTPLFLSETPRCPEHGILMASLDAGMFSAYSQAGRCPTCEGKGCKECAGSRMNKLLRTTQFSHTTWADLQSMPVGMWHHELLQSFSQLPELYQIAWKQVLHRIESMKTMGLGHLSLSRGIDTLSDGEVQRLRLVGLADGHLNGLLFVLDEPGAGLHPEDCTTVWELIQEIRNRGNTVLLIEHQMQFLQRADYLIEMGPGAGELGGQVLLEGPTSEVLSHPKSTTRIWNEVLSQPPPLTGAKAFSSFLDIEITPFRNLEKMEFNIPLQAFTALCGVSGSGKSTILMDGLAQKESNWFHAKNLSDLQIVNASRSGIRTSKRSTVATLIGLMTPLRDLFAQMPESKARGFGPGSFSTNTVGGRCEACLGSGLIEDPSGAGDFTCHVCQGRRFRDEILQVRFKTLNISEVLDLSVDSALHHFHAFPVFMKNLKPLQDTGLGYIRIGQSSSHLSSGELQRLELALALAKTNAKASIYLFDEPARGLHQKDLEHLILLFQKLISQGHTVIAIEHQPTLLRHADWILELHLGSKIYCGPLQKIKGNPDSRIAPWIYL